MIVIIIIIIAICDSVDQMHEIVKDVHLAAKHICNKLHDTCYLHLTSRQI